MAVTRTPTASDTRDLVARLHRVNLDSLPILHELLRTRSVTRTARSFGMTQPGISRVLRQLRTTFEDQLLVTIGREAQLTVRAEALIGPLHRALSEIGLLLDSTDPFDPATESVHVVIATADYVGLLLAPILAEICAAEAPHVVLEFTEARARNLGDLARVDFMIGPRAFGERLGKRVGSMPLWRDDIVCIAAESNPRIPARITAEQFQKARQVGMKSDPRVPLDIRLALQPTSALETSLVCTTPNFLVMGAIVEQADCVALVPRKVAQELMRSRRLRLVELAYPHRRLMIDAYWSLAASGKRGHAWFRSLLARAANRLGSTPPPRG
ncbi:LysR substrate binding domain-containing protein [Enhydrobacter aerosaccus]|uniref:LysR substrate binding domain-containing protein n=1 Tax=Enhydrobacter aerosaccus TaxID=225324 RepID=A0A1T4QR41_9HYPH|nr:LysR family transcriptional regulator [Enhydrobacter aerosaccus]SKA06165.1 LysR substrate binding domain-containing protein [Enhydrobacter aerosaccus]